MAVEAKQTPKTIKLTIVYGTNKELSVSPSDTIGAVKAKALDLFGVDQSELNNYVLRAKVKGAKDEQLDEARTVESYDLHNKQKVTLAAGTPFGAR